MKLALVAINDDIGIQDLEIWIKKRERAIVVVELIDMPHSSSAGHEILACAGRVRKSLDSIVSRRYGRVRAALPAPAADAPDDSDGMMGEDIPF